MQEIRDTALLQAYLRKFEIPSLFENGDLPFRLYCYEPGEIMNYLRPTQNWLKFVVDGSFDYYEITDTGDRLLLGHNEGFHVLGDLEFLQKTVQPRIQEVKERVYTVELPLQPLRQELMEDRKFLLFLLNTFADKLSSLRPVNLKGDSLEKALLRYLRQECPDHAIHSVETAAFHLNYSRRQLQRVLQKLTSEGVLKKCGKGCYQLVR